MLGMSKRTIFLTVWSLLVCVSTGQIAARAQTPDQAQIEKGRLVVTETCAACHTTITRMIQIHKQSPAEWKDTVYYMISRGAQVMPDEIDAVAAYLAEAGGKGPAQIAQGPGGGRSGGGRGEQQVAQADGPAIFQRTCQQCHELAVASNKMPSEEWSTVLTRMMTYGAKLTPADQERLAGYLNGLAK